MGDLENVGEGQNDIEHARLYYPKGVHGLVNYYITPLTLEVWLKVENLLDMCVPIPCWGSGHLCLYILLVVWTFMSMIYTLLGL